MGEVMKYLLEQNIPLVKQEDLLDYLNMSQTDWMNIADKVKGGFSIMTTLVSLRLTLNVAGFIVTNPGMKPSSLRVDQLDREKIKKDFLTYPEIVHFGIRPPQLSYAGNAE